MRIRDTRKATKEDPGYFWADGIATLVYNERYYVSLDDIIKLLEVAYDMAIAPKAKIQIENLKAGFIGLRMEADTKATSVIKA